MQKKRKRKRASRIDLKVCVANDGVIYRISLDRDKSV